MDDRPLSSISVPLSVPRLVRLFAWVVIVVAALQLFNGVVGYVLLRLVNAGGSSPLRNALRGFDTGATPHWALARHPQVMAHLPELALAQVALALLTLLAAIGLLRGRRWSQLYFVAWLALIVAASGAWLAWHVAERAGAQPASAGWVDVASAWACAYADMLVDGSAVRPTVVLVVTLLILAVIASPQALSREGSAARSAR
jgi:hypothetical protein